MVLEIKAASLRRNITLSHRNLAMRLHPTSLLYLRAGSPSSTKTTSDGTTLRLLLARLNGRFPSLSTHLRHLPHLAALAKMAPEATATTASTVGPKATTVRAPRGTEVMVMINNTAAREATVSLNTTEAIKAQGLARADTADSPMATTHIPTEEVRRRAAVRVACSWALLVVLRSVPLLVP